MALSRNASIGCATVALGLFGLLAIGLVAVTVGQDHEATPLPSFLHADKGLAVEATGNDWILFDAKLPKQPVDDDYVSVAAAVTKRLALSLQAGASDAPKTLRRVSVIFLRPDLDRLGNPGAHSFFTADFSTDDLRAAHVDRLGAYGTLNLATSVQVVLPWNEPIRRWCTDHDAAPEFCLRARSSLAPELQRGWLQ